MARKHLGWYCRQLLETSELRQVLMAAESSCSQYAEARRGFTRWASEAA
jgi:tRNA-dihydrouridine synthase